MLRPYSRFRRIDPMWRPQLSPLGLFDRTRVLNLAIALPLRNKAALTQFLREVSDPHSANYGHYLTPVTDLPERFGPTQSDYDAVIGFCRSQWANGGATRNTPTG